MDYLRLNTPIAISGLAYIVLTAPLLFFFYAALGKRYVMHKALWQGTKVVVSLVALSILWGAILHVGVAGKENPFGWVLCGFYAVIIGVIYVAVDRVVGQT